MDLWVIWLLVACAFAAGEIATTSFFLAPFALGAAVAAVLDAVGLPDGVSVAAFLAVGVLSFGFLRPVARRHLTQPQPVRTGIDALVGTEAIVSVAIDNDAEVGQVRLAGETWTARAYLDEGPIAVGTKVSVVQIKGATALVSE